MKPANFPGRKNERRIRALAQLVRHQNSKAERLDRPPGFSRDNEMRAVASRIIDADMVRNIRTKKDRRDRAKVAGR